MVTISEVTRQMVNGLTVAIIKAKNRYDVVYFKNECELQKHIDEISWYRFNGSVLLSGRKKRVTYTEKQATQRFTDICEALKSSTIKIRSI